MTVSDNSATQPSLLFKASPTEALVATGVESVEAGAGTQSSIDIAVYTSLEDAEAAWRACETAGACTAFQTYAWHAAWQRHIGAKTGARPLVVVGRLRGATLFIVPLAVERALGVRRLTWHASDLCDYNAPLLAPNFWSVVSREAFVDTLFPAIKRAVAGRRRFDLVSLTKMPERVGDLANPFALLSGQPNASGAHVMRLGDDWESFYAAKRSSSTRRKDRAKLKRLQEMGPVHFATSGAAEVNRDLDALFAQKSKALSAVGAPDFLAGPGVTEFFREVAATESQLVHVSHLMVGEVIAAVNLGLVFGGRYYYVLTSYSDGPVSKYGPGAAHLRELFAYAIGLGCRVFDFTIGDELYKTEWSDETLRLFDHRSAVTALGWLVACPEVAANRLKRLVKQTPILWKLAQDVRRVLRSRRPVDTDAQVEEQSD
jgi:CelD/BcsL family acetyltransferase involved in cellulose biosynthesis